MIKSIAVTVMVGCTMMAYAFERVPGVGSCREGVDLRCEYLRDPLGIDARQPRLSWRIENGAQSKEAGGRRTEELRQRSEVGGQKAEISNLKSQVPRGVRQTAYRVLVASSEKLLEQDKGDLWDSGKVESDQSMQIEYAGKPMQSRMRCYWKVKVWTTSAQNPEPRTQTPSSWSKPASWTMGLLDESAWTAKWISTEGVGAPPRQGGRLKILKAIYAARDGSDSADVTSAVADKIKDGTVDFIVQPDQLGMDRDPMTTHTKILWVEYEYNGAKDSIRAMTFQPLMLPPRHNLAPAALDEPYIRRVFSLDAAPESAFTTVNVLGFYELYVNGAKVGADAMSPALSDYTKRSLYRTYDLRPYLKKGDNCIGLWTSRGWYWKVTDGLPNPEVEHNTAIARLQLDMVVDGKPQRIGTDEQWRCRASGRSLLGRWSWNEMGGELVDARLDEPRWSDPETEDEDWHPVHIVQAPPIPAVAEKCPPTRIIKTLPAVACNTRPPSGANQQARQELDFGSNLTGWLRLRVLGLKAGEQITIRYLDKRNPDQSYNQFDVFISAGRPGEEFCSKFNYHGFRWAVIEGLPEAPRLADAEALALGADWETVGDFECSSPLFNRMHEVNLWTIRALSTCGFLSDCPHRERLGYGDGQVSIESAIMNFRMSGFNDKWATDWVDGTDPETGYGPHCAPYCKEGGGGPAWGGTAQALTWRQFLYYADKRMVARNYEACRRHVEAMEAHAVDDIVRAFGGKWNFIGDWVPPGRGMDTENWPPPAAAELFNNCYRLYLREQQVWMAEVLGKADEARDGRAELARLRPLVHRAFYDEKSQVYVLNEQAYYLMPLMTGVVPEELRPHILEKLEECIRVTRKGHLDTGMLGTYFLIQYLQEVGRNDLLFEVVNQTTYPGWGYMLEQGATTWWEQWNGYASQIHSCFTSLDGWFYQGLAGIRPDPAASGFKRIIIKPAVVGNLTWVKCHYDSPYGRIVSNWRRDGHRLTMDVTIPPNTTARVFVPALRPGAGQVAAKPGEDGPAKEVSLVTESGRPVADADGVHFLYMADGAAVFETGSGTYRFESNSK